MWWPAVFLMMFAVMIIGFLPTYFRWETRILDEADKAARSDVLEGHVDD